MRNKITLLLLSIFSLQLTAQERVVGDDIKIIERPALRLKSAMALDTILPPVSDPTTCDDMYYLFPADIGGYVTGTNYLGDLEKAQLFPSPQPGVGTIHGLLVYFAAKQIVGNPDDIYAKIYSAAPDGSPDSLLGVSDTLSLTEIDVSIEPNYFSFSAPVLYDQQFVASVVVDVGNDTVGIEHTAHGCGLGNAYERWPDGTWHPINETWDSVDVSIEIYAVVDDIISLKERGISGAGLELFPNPAEDFLQLRFAEAPKKDAPVEIKSIEGKSILKQTLATEPGKTDFSINIENLVRGTYILQTGSGKAKVQRVFVKR